MRNPSALGTAAGLALAATATLAGPTGSAEAAACGSPSLLKENGSVQLAHTCPGGTQVTYVVDCNFPVKFGDPTYSMYFETSQSRSITVCKGVGIAPTVAKIASWETS